jgi:hypothetical protein
MTIKPLPLFAVLLGATAAQAVTYDFSTVDQLTDNFSKRTSAGVIQDAGVLEYNITSGGSIATAYTYGSWSGPGGTGTFTPTAFTLSSTPLVVSMDILPPVITGTAQNTAFGIYISQDGAAGTTNNLFLNFNVNLSGGADTFRIYRDGSISSGTTGTLVAEYTQPYVADVMVPGGSTPGVFAPVTFSVTSTSVSLTVGGATLTQALTLTDINWSTANISFRAVDGANSGATINNLLQMDNFTISTVPEPSTYAAFAGLVVFTGTAIVRRRKRL